MKVIAKPGHICPGENRWDKPIDDKTPVDVLSSAYYRRRIADGSLLLWTGEQVTGEQAKPALAKNDKKQEAK